MSRYPYAPLADQPRAKSEPKRSDLHVLILGIVWLTIASGAIVFSEPAPFDVLMTGLIVLLPIAALAIFTPGMLLMLAAWLLIAGAGLGAAALSLDVAKSTIHTVVTLYLSVAAFILAGFIHKRPEAHTRLIMNAYLWSAAVACALAIIGYFNLLPGAHDLFTSFGRARGAFKDPNVFRRGGGQPRAPAPRRPGPALRSRVPSRGDLAAWAAPAGRLPCSRRRLWLHVADVMPSGRRSLRSALAICSGDPPRDGGSP